MMQKGTAGLGAAQMQSKNVHFPCCRKEGNSRDRLSVMSGAAPCAEQDSQGRAGDLPDLGPKSIVCRNRK